MSRALITIYFTRHLITLLLLIYIALSTSYEFSSRQNLLVSLLTIIAFTLYLLHGPYLLEMASIHNNLSIFLRGLG
jgi:hypothetical protein